MEMISSSLAICEENPLVTGGFPLQMANNMKHYFFAPNELQRSDNMTRFLGCGLHFYYSETCL